MALLPVALPVVEEPPSSSPGPLSTCAPYACPVLIWRVPIMLTQATSPGLTRSNLCVPGKRLRAPAPLATSAPFNLSGRHILDLRSPHDRDLFVSLVKVRVQAQFRVACLLCALIIAVSKAARFKSFSRSCLLLLQRHACSSSE